MLVNQEIPPMPNMMIDPMLLSMGSFEAQFTPVEHDPELLVGALALSMVVDNLAYDPQDTAKAQKITEAVGEANLATASYAYDQTVDNIPVPAILAMQNERLAAEKKDSDADDESSVTTVRSAKRRRKIKAGELRLAA